MSRYAKPKRPPQPDDDMDFFTWLATFRYHGNSNRARGKERQRLAQWERYVRKARVELDQMSQNQWVGPVDFWDPVRDHYNYRAKKRGWKPSAALGEEA